jgi:hypothetical protein
VDRGLLFGRFLTDIALAVRATIVAELISDAQTIAVGVFALAISDGNMLFSYCL